MPELADSSLQPRSGDISFNCDRCGASLVVDCAAAGTSLPCQRCGELTHVPLHRGERCGQATSPSKEKLEELERYLRENEAQRTEVTGHVNQLNIQLHRHKLRLQKLNERRAELQAEINRYSAQ